MTEALHPELAATLQGRNINHPYLVGTVDLDDDMKVAMANLNFEDNKRAVEKAKQEKDWRRFVVRHARTFRLFAFQQIQEQLSDSEYWRLLAYVWVESEGFCQMQADWSAMLSSHRGERHCMMTSEEVKAIEALPDPIRIHRGHNEMNAKGWSWTLDEEKAKWFARRAAVTGTPQITTVSVYKNAVVALMLRRNEKEIIVSPDVTFDSTTVNLELG